MQSVIHSLCRNISGGGHVHSIHEGPWLREAVHSTEISQVGTTPILYMRDLGWERCRDVVDTVGAHSYLLPINISHPWAPPHFQVPAPRLSPWRLGFLWQTSSLCLHARQASNNRELLPLNWRWEPVASCHSSPTPLAREPWEVVHTTSQNFSL